MVMQWVRHFYQCWSRLFGISCQSVDDCCRIAGMSWKWCSYSCDFILGNIIISGSHVRWVRRATGRRTGLPFSTGHPVHCMLGILYSFASCCHLNGQSINLITLLYLEFSLTFYVCGVVPFLSYIFMMCDLIFNRWWWWWWWWLMMMI